MLSVSSLRKDVIYPVLYPVGLWSKTAENLLVGTALAESYLGTLRQLGGGSALGFYQMEPKTYEWLWEGYLETRPNLRARVVRYVSGPITPPEAEQLAWNLGLATIMARLRYIMVSEPLPDSSDIEGLAAYWKKHYNTEAGKGKAEVFVNRYQLYGGR